MPKGRFNKWATATVKEPIGLGKSGIKIVVWDKWGRKRLGTAVISVAGIRWKSYKRKTWLRISWNKLDQTE